MPKRMPRFFIAGIFLLILILAARPAAAQDTIPSILTATPLPDGMIIHIVSPGENMASIAEAYGVSLATIRGLNGMAPESNLIFPGQRLIIRQALPPSATPTITATVPRPTRTPSPVAPTRTRVPTRTPTPSLTPSATIFPLVAAANGFVVDYRQPLLYVMIGLCAVGLVWVLVKGFLAK